MRTALSSGVLFVTCSTAVEVIDVPIKWKNDKYPLPNEPIGQSLMAIFMLDTIPALGRATFMAGNMIFLHSFSEKVHAATGYFSFEVILACRAVHDSSGEQYLILT